MKLRCINGIEHECMMGGLAINDCRCNTDFQMNRCYRCHLEKFHLGVTA